MVLVGTIGAAHGLKGEVRLTSHTGDPMAIADYQPLLDPAGNRLKIVSLRPAKGVLIARFAGVDDRNGAEALNGVTLFVPRSALPEPDEEEFYHEDLIGLSIRDRDGGTLGTVKAVQDFGAGDVLEIALLGGRQAMIPFTRVAVPQVRIADGYLVVDPLAAGLVSPESEEMDDEPAVSHTDQESRQPRPPRARKPRKRTDDRS